MARKLQWAALAVGIVLIVVVGITVFVRDTSEPQASDIEYTPQTEQVLYSMPPSMVVIGDSYTGGSDMGGRGPKNWAPILANQLGYLPCSYAVGGSGWVQGRAGVTFGSRVDWALGRDPDVIIFFNGVNDLKSPVDEVGRAADTALANLRAQNPAIPVVLIGPVLVHDSSAAKTHEMADQLEAAANRHDVIFIDPAEEGWFSGPERRFIGSDRFHPTDEGMVYLAGKIEESLRRVGLADLPDRERPDRVCSVPTPPAATTTPASGR